MQSASWRTAGPGRRRRRRRRRHGEARRWAPEGRARRRGLACRNSSCHPCADCFAVGMEEAVRSRGGWMSVSGRAPSSSLSSRSLNARTCVRPRARARWSRSAPCSPACARTTRRACRRRCGAIRSCATIGRRPPRWWLVVGRGHPEPALRRKEAGRRPSGVTECGAAVTRARVLCLPCRAVRACRACVRGM